MSNQADVLGWSSAQLGRICTLRGEIVQPPFAASTRYVGLEHIDSGSPALERWGSASEVVSAKARFCEGDVLYGKLRPYLDKSVLVTFDGICSTDILVLKASERLTAEFLAHFVHTRAFIQAAVRSTGGVNLPRTSWNALAKMEFALPPLLEQHAIAHTLRTVQDAIAARRREVELECERKAALMQHLFTYGTRGEPTKMTEIGEMPESWQVVRLGEMVTLQRGFDLPESKRIPGQYPVMGGNGVSGRHSEYTTTGPGVCVGRSGAGVGKINWIDADYWALNTALWVSDFHENHPRFVYYRLLTQSLWQYAGGASVPTLNRNLVHPVPVGLPSLSEQVEIAGILTAADAKASSLEQEVTLLEELFRALLEELMTGRLSALPLIGAGTGAERAPEEAEALV